MKKKIFSSVILLLLISFKSFAATDGKGEIQLSENVVNNFMNYITGKTTKNSKSLLNKPSTFWVTIDGRGSYWWYCSHGGGCQGDTSNERIECEKYHGKSCSRFARGRYVRWDNGINPKGKASKFSSKMSESEIRTKLTKLGFYDNDSITTSNTDEIDVETNSSKSLTDQLSDLSKLFEDGLITEEEFIKAKKKLLN